MVHVIFNAEDVHLDSFSQIGGGIAYFEGLPLIHQRGYGYFAGYPLVYQRGHGLGDIFRSIYRALKPMAIKIGQTLGPIAKEAGQAIGKEGIATSARVLNEIVQGKEAKSALLDEGREGVRRLFDKANTSVQERLQRGSGRRRLRKIGGSHVVLKPKSLEGKEVRLKRPISSTFAKLYPSSKKPHKKQRHDALGFY